MTLLINEIFHTIQGESLWMGLPCIFVRLSGCNLRCRYCDTRYAYEPGDPKTVKNVLEEVSQFDCRRITITGGEPLLQDETSSLITLLLDNHYFVSLETNGTLDIGRIDARCMKIVDVKCPSSGMQGHHRMENSRLLGPNDQIKFVMADREDFDFATSFSDRLSSRIAGERILFSPVHGVMAPDQLAQWMLESHSRARLHIQLHKVLWPDRDRGV